MSGSVRAKVGHGGRDYDIEPLGVRGNLNAHTGDLSGPSKVCKNAMQTKLSECII